ncbi:hypothetical protein BDY21DRAFT_137490 [Lineolata rhizophorae]|uniref:Uncharacterized protein n=1 Tax=Lineolata rhizophorae TaxID=578093 RepID=A0A6A6PAV0_9PEZI|nr:hypothetical protein BDY21DRAFT_137490 [Lineolata rhizophorae]
MQIKFALLAAAGLLVSVNAAPTPKRQVSTIEFGDDPSSTMTWSHDGEKSSGTSSISWGPKKRAPQGEISETLPNGGKISFGDWDSTTWFENAPKPPQPGSGSWISWDPSGKEKKARRGDDGGISDGTATLSGFESETVWESDAEAKPGSSFTFDPSEKE